MTSAPGPQPVGVLPQDTSSRVVVQMSMSQQEAARFELLCASLRHDHGELPKSTVAKMAMSNYCAARGIPVFTDEEVTS